MTTSSDALDGLDITKLEGIAEQCIRRAGVSGATSDEVRRIARVVYGITAYSSMTARWAGLVKRGRIVRLGKPYTRAGDSGRQQQIMYAPEFAPKGGYRP